MSARLSLAAAALACALAVRPAAAVAEDAPRRVSLLEAVDLAVRGSAGVLIGSAGVDAAQARVDGTRALRLPRLHLSGNVLLWNESLVLDLGTPLPPGTSPPEVCGLVTSTATLTLAQPLSGLLVVNVLIGVEQDGVAAAKAEYDVARLDAGYRAAEAYLRLLQAKALRDVTARSITQLDAQLARAKVLADAGVLGKVDLLRLESARDALRGQLIKTDSLLTTAERGLALALALDEPVRLEAFDDLPDPPPPLRWSEDEAVQLAVDRRPELRAARERAEQAAGGKQVARSDFYPSIFAVATFQHTEGQGTFQPKNAFFLGLTLEWDLWDWGKNRADVTEAGHRQRQAELARDATVDVVIFDVQRRYQEAHAAHQLLGIGAQGLAAAEEAYRLQTLRFTQGDATTVEVLDAETEVARARTQQALARYDYYLALVALARAVGELPEAVNR